MKIFAVFTILSSVLFCAFGAGDNPDRFGAVVKVMTVDSRPNYYLPWQNLPQSQSNSSGFVIEGKRIVTNAHAVANGTFITVRKLGDQNPWPARVAAVCHECDLAILSVNDPRFFDGIVPLEFGELPPLQSPVSAAGYPVGGDNVSITSGVLSRIEPVYYSHSGAFLLAAQIDAAINPGNSGGPVLHDGKVVGVAFQGINSAQNIGYLIPSQVVSHFLKDLEDGTVNGFPGVPFTAETMENPDLRRFYRMDASQSGILVTEVPELLKEKAPLVAGDVVLAVDGRTVANDGTVQYNGQALHFGTVFWDKQIGEKLPLSVWRDGKVMEIETITGKLPRLIPPLAFDRAPAYFMAGGVVFMPVTANYLGLFREVPDNLGVFRGKMKSFPDEELVVVSMVLADEVNLGYQWIDENLIESVNGKKIRNLAEVAAILDEQKEGFVEIRLRNKFLLVMDMKKVREATPRIMSRYRMSSDRSDDLN